MNSLKNFGCLILLILFTSGCASCPFKRKAPAPGLVGTWKLKDSFQGQQTIKFKANETYEIDFDGDHQTDVWGSYKVLWEKITFMDKKGAIPEDCLVPGVYIYSQTGDQLHYTLVSDSCTSRQKVFNQIWQKIADMR